MPDDKQDLSRDNLPQSSDPDPEAQLGHRPKKYDQPEPAKDHHPR